MILPIHKAAKLFVSYLSKPKLRDHTRNFAAICNAPIADVPTLEDFLSGKNIPASKVIGLKPPRGYIAAFPVVDALDYAAALKQVGDRVELVGKIVEVKTGVAKRGKGKDKPYIFVNFGPWKWRIIKIAIWSEGLAKLKEPPSNAWIGRWVSVTGLMDAPYISERYGYEHLSISVEEDGQILRLDETQARFRLASIVKSPAGRNRTNIEETKKTTTAKPSTQTTTTTPTATAASPPSKNRDLVTRYTQGTQPSSRPSTSPAHTRPASRSSSTGLFEKIPLWVWVVGAVVILLLLMKH
jgi:hypothetical protein